MFVVLHPHEPSLLSGYDDQHLQGLLLSPFLCLVLAFAYQVYPVPELEGLGSAPSLMFVGAPPPLERTEVFVPFLAQGAVHTCTAFPPVMSTHRLIALHRRRPVAAPLALQLWYLAGF